MKIPRQTNGGEACPSPATLSQSLYFLAGRLSHQLVAELRRLNSARVGIDELSRLAPRDRARAVKAALAAHHKGRSRCC